MKPASASAPIVRTCSSAIWSCREEDGLDLIRQIRVMDERAGTRTPAAALSALARADDRRRALSAGYQMHVTKPIDPLELASTIERLAAGKLPEARHV